MTFHCATHDYKWTMRAGHIKKDSCKMCRATTKANAVRDLILSANKNIELLSPYVDYQTKIEWRCTIDGYVHASKPSHLKRGDITCVLCSKRDDATAMWKEIVALSSTMMLLDVAESPDDPVYVRYKDNDIAWEDTIRHLLEKLKRLQ